MTEQDKTQYDYLANEVALKELIKAAVGYGYGSGEELYELLADTEGISPEEAELVVDVLSRAV